MSVSSATAEHLHAGLGQRRTRAVGGIDLDFLVKQLARKIGDAGAIRDREQGSHSVLSSLVAARAKRRCAGVRVYPRRALSLCEPRPALLLSAT